MSQTLPKSMHTATVLANVARALRAADSASVPGRNAAEELQIAGHYILRAMLVLGYGTATNDPHGARDRALLMTLLPMR